jgi:hypothetical protein
MTIKLQTTRLSKKIILNLLLNSNKLNHKVQFINSILYCDSNDLETIDKLFKQKELRYKRV